MSVTTQVSKNFKETIWYVLWLSAPVGLWGCHSRMGVNSLIRNFAANVECSQVVLKQNAFLTTFVYLNNLYRMFIYFHFTSLNSYFTCNHKKSAVSCIHKFTVIYFKYFVFGNYLIVRLCGYFVLRKSVDIAFRPNLFSGQCRFLSFLIVGFARLEKFGNDSVYRKCINISGQLLKCWLG